MLAIGRGGGSHSFLPGLGPAAKPKVKKKSLALGFLTEPWGPWRLVPHWLQPGLCPSSEKQRPLSSPTFKAVAGGEEPGCQAPCVLMVSPPGDSSVG